MKGVFWITASTTTALALTVALAAPASAGSENPKEMDPSEQEHAQPAMKAADEAVPKDAALDRGSANPKELEGQPHETQIDNPHNNPKNHDNPNDRSDADVWAEATIVTSYTLNTQLNPFDLNVDVADGNATLTGTVESEIEKHLAAEIARDAEGVDEVTNRIEVSADTARRENPDESGFFATVSNATTAARIDSKLLWNANTSGTNIDVEVSGETATLSGTVASGAERELAEQIARNTGGIDRVVNELKVDADQKSLAEEAETTVSDAWITTKVKSTLAYSSNVSALDIDVDTKEGAVTLSGTVDSQKQEQQALDLARDVVGVKSVNDQLVVENRVDVSGR